MTTAPVIAAGLNAVVLALTPVEKWRAARRMESSFVGEHWFILICAIAMVVLTVWFIVATYKHMAKQRRTANQLFFEYSDRMGLSRRERQVLMDIAARTKLKRNESIFTMVTAFDRGAAALTKETLAQQGAQAGSQLGDELSVIREKLGFQKQRAASKGPATKPNKPSSRQIPAGKKVHITRRKAGDSANIESTVIENNDTDITVKLTVSLESSPGELWCVRYYFGASVWEFETSSVSCDHNILVLNHSDDVRFVNRRRFVRVPVNRPTLIARFPFAISASDKDSGKKLSGAGPDSAGASGEAFGPPEFVPASVTELAGPGLRIEAPLEMNVGDRVLVVLKLSEEDGRDSGSKMSGKGAPARIVEDIGEVRHTKAIQSGFSIAVELTGLSDSNIGELVRATNAASLKAGDKTRDVPEPAAVQRI
jgi:hypothetical protein